MNVVEKAEKRDKNVEFCVPYDSNAFVVVIIIIIIISTVKVLCHDETEQ